MDDGRHGYPLCDGQRQRSSVSLLPYKYHVDVAKLCLKHRKPLVTTSYVSPAMQALHDDAVKAGVIFLNEAGLDPG